MHCCYNNLLVIVDSASCFRIQMHSLFCTLPTRRTMRDLEYNKNNSYATPSTPAAFFFLLALDLPDWLMLLRSSLSTYLYLLCIHMLMHMHVNMYICACVCSLMAFSFCPLLYVIRLWVGPSKSLNHIKKKNSENFHYNEIKDLIHFGVCWATTIRWKLQNK